MKVDSTLPYSERKLQTTANHTGRVVADLADVYVSGLSVMKPETTGLMWLDIGMAVGHAAFGLNRMSRSFDEGISQYEATRYRTQAFGEALQVAGYVGLACGMGAWALPIVGLGLGISNFAYLQ